MGWFTKGMAVLIILLFVGMAMSAMFGGNTNTKNVAIAEATLEEGPNVYLTLLNQDKNETYNLTIILELNGNKVNETTVELKDQKNVNIGFSSQFTEDDVLAVVIEDQNGNQVTRFGNSISGWVNQ
ncbi:MAG: hypothetical protein BTN85_1644 [Candidatus Methanohalarchaeum thermophilum]|uniref:Uncharacterized protein n=1 Tax=Methanohalarchaeum thermophilum TaxID=1903181 RepID=A0A1Q6DXQ5_METT1|nr:MAG: hypothetical protein BTN85_1644 [Candidatus Methanohalarchaeum thermophilum]